MFRFDRGLVHNWELWILTAGMLLRGLWAWVIPNEPVSDFLYYYEMAKNFTLPSDQWNLGYVGPASSFVLALVFQLSGSTELWIAKAFQVVLSCAALFLFTLVSRSLFHKYEDHLLAITLFALLPNYITYTSVVGTEPFVLLLMVTMVWIHCAPTIRWWHTPAIGILAGIAALTKPYFLAFPALTIAIRWFRTRSTVTSWWKSLLRPTLHGIMVALVMAITISPMTWYNFDRWGMWIPVSFNGGYNIFLNNNDANTVGRYIYLEQIPISTTFQQKLDEAGIPYAFIDPRVEHLYREEAIKWIQNHPIAFMKLGCMRLFNTFLTGAWDIGNWTNQPDKEPLRSWLANDAFRVTKTTVGYLADALIYAIVVLTLAGGLWKLAGRGVRGDQSISPALAPVVWLHIAFFSSIFFVFEGQARYNFPILFLFILGTVYTIRLFRHHRSS